MENFTCRSCDYHRDLSRLMNLWLAYRAVADVRAYPTIWRLRLLLTSRVGDASLDTKIWENATGELAAFAMLWRRHPTSTYRVLDIFIHPSVATDELLSAVLRWGDHRLQAMAKAQKAALTTYASVFSSPNFLWPALQLHGYTIVPPNPDERNVYFSRALRDAVAQSSLPQGYQIHPLRNIDDLKAYHAVYGFSKVDPLHQRELMASDEYCHLVVRAPDGAFVAYSECSRCYAEWERTGQRIGWIDYVETRPEYQNQGLGKAVLLAGLSQLQQWGADTAMLVTVSANTPAINLYLSTGFVEVAVRETPSYQKLVQA